MHISKEQTADQRADQRAETPPRQALVLMTRSEKCLRDRSIKNMLLGTDNVADIFVLKFNPDLKETGSFYEYEGVRVFEVTYKDLDDSFRPYPGKYQNRSDWRIMPGNLDLIQMYLTRKAPEYEHYWFMEDDVRFTGYLKDLVAQFSCCDDDLLATNLGAPPQGWGGGTRLYSNGGTAEEVRLRAFLPFFRVSRKFLEKLHEAYLSGVAGHHEATWPYVAESAGLKMRDFNAVDDMVWYEGSGTGQFLRTGTFRYRPSFPTSGSRSNTLYHPVKGWTYWLREKLGYKNP